MPLPTNGSISLQGHSRPGEGVTTKPKLAMIVKMTEETLDALQNLSMEDRVEFEFGDHPVRPLCGPISASQRLKYIFVYCSEFIFEIGPSR